MSNSGKLQEKVLKAIQRLRAFEPEDGYFLAYSGGKDSDCIRILADLANVKHENVHNLTSVDAPETVRYIKAQPDVDIRLPRDKDGKHMTMWNLIVKKKTPPLRISRWCCSELKESGGKGRVVVTGVRWDESLNRKKRSDVVQILGKPKHTQKMAEELGADYRVNKEGSVILNLDNDESRRMVEHCYRTTKTMVNPIVDWLEEEVWEFLNYYNCKSNPLYECGFKRIGCIGCPMAGRNARLREFERYPAYKKMYIKSFDKMLDARKKTGLETRLNWESGQEVFDWWIKG